MKKIFYLILVIIFLLSCAKKKNIPQLSKSAEDLILNSSSEMISPEDVKKIADRLADMDIKVSSKNIKKPEYKISTSYLKDPLEFKSLDISKYKGKDLAVVGTKNVKLYKDINGKEVINSLPKGSILIIKNKLMNKEKLIDYYEGVYQFENEYNWWYEVDYEGRTGYAFGSYLITDENTFAYASHYDYLKKDKLTAKQWEKFIRLSYYYNKPVNQAAFYDFNGSSNIPDNVKNALVNDKFVLEKIDYNTYGMTIESPDDMSVLYKGLAEDDMATIYITTDYLVHNLHLLFDRMLQDSESRIFLPTLMEFTKEYFKTLSDYEQKLSDNDKSLKESVILMKKYFIVAQSLLGLNLLSQDSYPDDVKQELDHIDKAEGFVEETPLFKYKEDYSQFKPRGHYTKTENLKKYFKAMMWFGRLHFYCEKDNPDPKINENSIRLTKAALLLSKIAKENSYIYSLWKAISQPINYMIGASDDYTFEQYLSLSNEVDYNNFSQWLENDKNILNFIDAAHKKLSFPKISGNTLMQSQKLEENSPTAPAGFRVFGQRFTFDSFIHNLLSSPRVANRNMVKSADIMAVMGNSLADSMINDDKKRDKRFDSNFNYLKKQFNSFDDNDFRSTFYNSYLRIIKESATFDKSKPFYFTQSDNWNKRILLTSCGSWAELRHDTILYVKQSYAEKAGKGPEPTWRIDKVTRPISYVEPNLGVLYWLESILNDSDEILAKNGIMSEQYRYKFEDYLSIMNSLVTIAEKESNDKPISDEENNFIYSIPGKVSKIIAPIEKGDLADQKDLEMALVADVHTDSVDGVALEVATGVPYRLYVALNDGQGGKRIAEGYTYSYYEFSQPISNRLNDDQWKEKVYSDDKGYLESRLPNWIKDILQE